MTESNIEIGGLSMKARVISLLIGPLLALVTFYLLPDSYQNAAGKTVAFAYEGKALSLIHI